MGRPLTVAPLGVAHRGAVEEIVRTAGVFHEADIRIALELFDETYGDPSRRRTAETASPPPPDGGDSDYQFLGLFEGANRLVGYVCFGPTPGTDRGYDVYWIAVAPSVQGTGGGTILLREVERQLRERNVRLVLAETPSRPEYVATRAFYAARGYREAARVREFYGPGDDRVLFTKRLQPAPRPRGGRAEEGA